MNIAQPFQKKKPAAEKQRGHKLSFHPAAGAGLHFKTVDNHQQVLFRLFSWCPVTVNKPPA
jgi:hypothetical protein